jgi:hypothetical protein
VSSDIDLKAFVDSSTDMLLHSMLHFSDVTPTLEIGVNLSKKAGGSVDSAAKR